MSCQTYQKRIKLLQGKFDSLGVDGFITTKRENQLYLTGFTGSVSWLYITCNSGSKITNEDIKLFVDGRYKEQAAFESPHVTIVLTGKQSLTQKIKSSTKNNSYTKDSCKATFCKETFYKDDAYYKDASCPEEVILAIKESFISKDKVDKKRKIRIGFEPKSMNVSIYKYLIKRLRGVSFIPTQNLVESIRMIKDKEEISIIEKALRIGEEGLSHILGYLKPGIQEKELANEFQYKIRKMGADKEAFDIIIASGARSSFPHGRASSKVIEEGDLVIMDLGARYEWYHSDITRTVALKRISPKGAELYKILREAQDAAFSCISPGVKAKDVDLAARRVVEAAGYGELFCHGLGHGVGLEVHELPRIHKYSDTVLESGMVFTIEPGIYLSGVMGVRLEDMIMVTQSGCEVLTKFPKEILLYND